MNILINLSTLKKGGGQNVGLNFLSGLLELKDYNDTYFFLVVKNSQIHEFLLDNNRKNILITSPSPIKRIYKEVFTMSSIFRKLKIDVIYTYFGYGLFRSDIPQICGVAVSNIFFPEIKFWHGNFRHVLLRKIIDRYWIFGIKRADALIFENKIMEKRCQIIYGFPENRTVYISPSFNSDYNSTILEIEGLKENTVKLLMLCGWQLNKNIMRVPEIAFNLKKTNQSYQFIITAPKDNSKEHKKFISLSKHFGVEDMINLIGPVKKKYLDSLYKQIDYVLLMSKLESFSNNIIEAWNFKKPLIVSNEQWSNSICKNAAYYIQRESPGEIANSIDELRQDKDLQNKLINEGTSQLNDYPSILEKTKSEILFIKKIYNDCKTDN